MQTFLPHYSFTDSAAALRQVQDHPQVRSNALRPWPFEEKNPLIPASLWIDLVRAFEALAELEQP